MDKKLANELLKQWEEMGDSHISGKQDTPLREDAFVMDDALKIELIAKHFKEIMHVLGLDLTDESLQGTPLRVAKMYVNEHFKGLDPKNHHFVPIYGFAHVAYISSGKVIGLSKLNRIVDYFARRPQVQERMTVQVAEELKQVLGTQDVAVIIDAKHMCVASRGIKDSHSSTVTSSFHGKFLDVATRSELLKYIGG
jgi:GTP cyclohydrolase I